MTLPPVPHGDLICSYKFLELEIGRLSQETSVFQQQPKDHGKMGSLESPTLCEFRSRTCRAAGTNNSCPNSREPSQLRAPRPLQTEGHPLASTHHMGPTHPSLSSADGRPIWPCLLVIWLPSFKTRTTAPLLLGLLVSVSKSNLVLVPAKVPVWGWGLITWNGIRRFTVSPTFRM